MGDMAEWLSLQEDRNTDTREEEWSRGFHRLRDGTLIKIKDMSYNHLRNSISKFKNRFDVSAFEKEFNNK